MNTKEKDYASISKSVNAMRDIQRLGAVQILNESEEAKNDDKEETEPKAAAPYSPQDEL